jgi:hypothetical protein
MIISDSTDELLNSSYRDSNLNKITNSRLCLLLEKYKEATSMFKTRDTKPKELAIASLIALLKKGGK